MTIQNAKNKLIPNKRYQNIGYQKLWNAIGIFWPPCILVNNTAIFPPCYRYKLEKYLNLRFEWRIDHGAKCSLIIGILLVFWHKIQRLHLCWWRMLETKYVGDGFGHFGHQHPLSPNISVEHQLPKDATNILKLSPATSHQHHNVTNMTVVSSNRF